jgi:hypothetical protein
MTLHKLSVDEAGLTQMVELLGRDCTPTQFVREFVMNSIEAIQRVQNASPETDFEGKILVDYDHQVSEALGAYKITFIDNGDGMTGEEMIQHLNRLSSSGYQNTYKNYGMGAKIASLTRNHEGIIYKSWKNGIGSQVFIKYDTKSKSYGVQPVPNENDETLEWSPKLENDQKPDLINQHGTQVTLLGMEQHQDTMMMPSSSTKGGRENWLYQFVNTRFYQLPRNVELKVRIAYDKPDETTSYLGKINGQSKTLDNQTEKTGVVKLSDALVHWRILKDKRTGHGREYLAGHTATLNQSEIIEIKEGRANKAPDFGIYVGKEDVVLIVEPSAPDYLQNTSRTGLVQMNGSELPWDKWADEFRADMPPELKEYIEKRLSAINSSSDAAAIKDRLKSIAKLFKLNRFKPDAAGQIIADPNSEVSGKTGEGTKDATGSKTGTRSIGGVAGGSLQVILLSGLSKKGTPSISISPDSFPDLMWANPDQEEALNDRAAVYYEKDNKIIANNEFQGIRDVIEHFAKIYPDKPEAYSVITPLVKAGFEQQLIEVVYGALSFKNRSGWNPDDYKTAISPEALTTAVMCRFHLIQQVNRTVKNQLGKPESAAS